MRVVINCSGKTSEPSVGVNPGIKDVTLQIKTPATPMPAETTCVLSGLPEQTKEGEDENVSCRRPAKAQNYKLWKSA